MEKANAESALSPENQAVVERAQEWLQKIDAFRLMEIRFRALKVHRKEAEEFLKKDEYRIKRVAQELDNLNICPARVYQRDRRAIVNRNRPDGERRRKNQILQRAKVANFVVGASLSPQAIDSYQARDTTQYNAQWVVPGDPTRLASFETKSYQDPESVRLALLCEGTLRIIQNLENEEWRDKYLHLGETVPNIRQYNFGDYEHTRITYREYLAWEILNLKRIMTLIATREESEEFDHQLGDKRKESISKMPTVRGWGRRFRDRLVPDWI